ARRDGGRSAPRGLRDRRRLGRRRVGGAVRDRGGPNARRSRDADRGRAARVNRFRASGVKSMMTYKPALSLLVVAWPALTAQSRVMRPDDLFRIERVAAIAWSADGARAAVQITRPGRWLGSSPPTGDISVIDVASGRMSKVSMPRPGFVGFFGPSWSPDGKSLAFFSVDTNAIVRPWIWRAGLIAPVSLRGLQMHDDLADSP